MEIENNNIYLTRMAKTFFDKAWFIAHLPEKINTIVDFGCADGSFMQFIQKNCPSMNFIGIENNPVFQKETEKKGFKCYEFLKDLNIDPNKSCLVLSSALHEIYCYADRNEFWNQVNEFCPKYIAIRDMMGIYDNMLYYPDFVAINDIFKKTYRKEYDEFKEIWGEFNKPENIIHFLLKYFYEENWKREVRENYLIVNKEELYKRIYQLNYGTYNIEFEEYYKLPYLVNKWKYDFEVEQLNYIRLDRFISNMTTHYKMLLKRN